MSLSEKVLLVFLHVFIFVKKFHSINGTAHFVKFLLEPIEGISSKVNNIKIWKKKLKETAMVLK